MFHVKHPGAQAPGNIKAPPGALISNLINPKGGNFMANQNFTRCIIEGIKDYMGCGCSALSALKLYKLDILDDLDLTANMGDHEAQDIIKHQLQLIREIESTGEENIVYCLEYLQAMLEIDTDVVEDYMKGGDLL